MTSEPKRRLSATAIAAHLSCEHKTQLDRMRRSGDVDITFQPDARLDALIERGLRFETAFVESLREQGCTVEHLPKGANADATFTAMKRGIDILVQAPLENEIARGTADILRKVKIPSRLGAWSYEPIDTKLGEHTKATAVLQLLVYAELLHAMQGHRPQHVFVQTPAGEERYRTADYDAFYRRVARNTLSAALSQPAPETYPNPVENCDVCHYWRHCADQRRRDDHLSLVAGMRTANTRELHQQGIETVASLVETQGELRTPPRRGNADSYRLLARQASLQVQARGREQVPYEFLDSDPGRGLQRLPEPTDGDLFLDFEGDAFVGDGGREYLTGWVESGDEGPYHAHWSLTPKEEKRAIENFLDAVAASRERHGGMHIYHFAAYEPAALKRVTQRHQTRIELLDELLREHRFVDLRTVVREALRVGVESYGLKDLERVFHFRRELALFDAGKAKQQFEIALELDDAETVCDPALRSRVAAYNRDDCVSTRALQRWLERLRAQRIGDGYAIDRPDIPDGEARESVTERRMRIEALEARLREGLPEEPEDRDERQRGRALLADLVGYYQREDKCAYWEHYRLRELAEHERMNEREMIAGLEFVRVAAPVGSERKQRHVFSFPPQEAALDGKTVYCVRDDDGESYGKELGDVKHIDLNACEVTILRTGPSLSIQPTAVFRQQGVPTKILEESLHEFATHVADSGLTDDVCDHWGPATDLLLRREPRFLDRDHGAPLRAEGESAADALADRCRSLNRSLLAVQGPPGTGKSHNGALAVLALLRAGKTVGVTAVSHKVILNFLRKVQELAEASGQAVSLMYTKKQDDLPPGCSVVPSSAPPQQNAVLGGTAWTWATDKREERVDYLFVDEAGQMALPSVLAASRGARNVVLLGDPMQLEQPRRGAHPEGADRAALVHLLDDDRQTLRPEQGIFLDTTWRMHPSIAVLTSELYYEGRLRALHACERQRLDGTDGFDGAGLHLCEVDHHGNQARSPEEVDAAVAVAQRLLRAGATFTDRAGERHALTPDHVLVVAPYNSQVAALTRALAPLRIARVGTVDRFQGQEAPIVIYSCTSSSAEDAPRGMPFLFDPHRFNVATSRATACAIVIASPRLLSPECKTVEQLRMANGLCRFAELASHVGAIRNDQS